MTEQERRKCPVHHIVHDYANLVSAGRMTVDGHHLGRPLVPPVNTHVGHAFYGNCRKMYEFFVYRPSKEPQDDIRAGEFTITKVEFELPTWKTWHNHMKKHLVHVTRDRTTSQEAWSGHTENERFLNEFQAAWTKFLSSLQPQYRVRFEEEIAAKLFPTSEFRYYDLGLTSFRQ